ncbi:MAG: hypothetical protein FJ104_16195 [Deltaproteobacteria bacterium]|nr:hypothetical protein [Deltaproteobacteria bacterium]
MRFHPTHATSVALLSLLATACGGDDDADSKSGRVEVQISGEDLATDGIPFPEGGEVVLADGWALTFSHVLVTVGGITLSSDPDRAPADQLQAGDPVARLAGTWAVDLAKAGAVPGAGGEGTAHPLGVIEERDGGGALRAGERFAFSYALERPSASAERVAFDADAEALYARMVESGDAILFAGEATFRGEDCSSTDSTYDFGALPTKVPFEIGLPIPTGFVNCQNEANAGEPFDGEEFQRGVPIPESGLASAQLTIHVDHLLYTDVQHEPELRFDPMAAQLVGAPAGTKLTADLLRGVDPTAFTDGSGAPLPARRCVDGELPSATQLAFDPGTVPVDPSAAPDAALRDYLDFVAYVVSTAGHLNGGEGLCAVKRGYPSPR